MNGCRKYAWGHDDLTPLSKGYFDGRNGWGASIVDAMTTLVRVISPLHDMNVLKLIRHLQQIMGEEVAIVFH